MTDEHAAQDQDLATPTRPSDQSVDDMPRRDLLAGLGRFASAAPALALLTRPKLAQADYGGPRKDRGRYTEG